MPFWAVGATLLGSALTSNSASGAAASQSGATNAATAENARQYDSNKALEQQRFDLNRSDRAPYMAAGQQALGQLQNGLNAPVDPRSDPGYQFGLDQGQQAIDRKAAASGGRISGSSLKDASTYATNYGASKYQEAYQRGQDRLNRLATMAGYGQVAPSGSLGQQPNNGNAALISSQGNATGAAQLAQGNIWGNTANQLGAIVSRYNPTNSPTNSNGSVNNSFDPVAAYGGVW